MTAGSPPFFRFVDMGAAVSSRRLAAERAGGQCVLSIARESDRGRRHPGNSPSQLHSGEADKVPAHDLLMIGVTARAPGEGRDQLIDACRMLIREGGPTAVIIDAHPGMEADVQMKALETMLKGERYHVLRTTLMARDFGLPHRAKRRFLIGTHRGDLTLSSPPACDESKVASFLEERPESRLPADSYVLLRDYQVKRQAVSGLVFCGYRKGSLRQQASYEEMHLSRVHRQQNRIYRSDGFVPALTTSDPAARIWILHEGRVRRLSLREAFRIYGYPDDFVLPKSRAAGVRILTESAPVPLAEFVIREVVKKTNDRLSIS